MTTLKIVIYSLGGLFVLFTLIPLIRNDYWVFRVFEYPRFQKFIIVFIILIASLFLVDWASLVEIAFALILFANVLFLAVKVFPFTPFAPRQLKQIRLREYKEEDAFGLMVANVYQYNRKSDRLLKIIDKVDPDILLLVETDEWWNDQLKVIHSRYQEKVLEPLNNTYGMLFFSKFPLHETEIKYLVEDDKPSIHTRVALPSSKTFRLFGIHPAPPGPQHNERTTERDKELLLVGEMAKKERLPTIVTGDLNDVAWSYTTRLFVNVSGLLDPRRGRGMYNTFNAKYPIFRWPLDHIFCSSQFKLIRLRKLPFFGSDHFPLLIKLMLTRNGHLEQETPTPSEEEKELAKEKLEAEV